MHISGVTAPSCVARRWKLFLLHAGAGKPLDRAWRSRMAGDQKDGTGQDQSRRGVNDLR